jgi:hypothetical protein
MWREGGSTIGCSESARGSDDFSCGGRRAACEFSDVQPTRLPLQIYLGVEFPSI